MDNKKNYTNAYEAKEITNNDNFLLLVKIKTRLKYLLKILNYIILIVIGLFFVYPFAWMASMSLRPLIEALSFDPGFNCY